ncbi:uncharacterized protein PRCAT00002712001 [Priceomyces carsonii]|uniref:uncharacterized protein n=1 Tax=Priceomyces carsonii TaxID=28549 RepID=UPI002ED88356|nr:unnamed protein product [Priceomyces carsonii]
MGFDKTRLTPCPVLHLSDHDMKDPIGYLSRPDIAKLGSEYGIVKLVPPTTWRPRFLLSDHFRFHTRLQKLSDLGLTTRSRNFFRDNINRFLKMRRRRQLKLYFKVDLNTDVFKNVKVHYYDLYVAVENIGGIDKMDEGKWEQLNNSFGIPKKDMKLKEEYDTNLKEYVKFLDESNHQNYEFPDSDSEDESGHCLICGRLNHPSQTLLCDNCDNAYHLSCLLPPLEYVPLGSWFCDKCLIGTGEYGFEEAVDIKYTLPEFLNICLDFEQGYIRDSNYGQPMDLNEIERKFWKLVDTQNSDLEVKYGADIHNLRPGEISGFPMSNSPNLSLDDPDIQSYINHPCNLTKLPFAKGSLLNYINTTISGMTIPWIYIGSLFSTFCWHVEDHYTLSANYCHFGATKKWYGIPSYDADKFEKLMKESAPNLFKKQPDLLHQLVTLLSPMTLVDNGIRCVYADQNPNEFVITYPRVYHAGFNSGFNFNEAVNFAMSNWLEFGEKSIYDYKLIKKESVFDHYSLVENILKDFNRKQGYISATELSLVKRSIDSFERFIERQSTFLSKLDKSRFSVVFKPKQIKERKFEDEKIGVFEKDDDEDEEDLCDLCRTYISYQYCLINNESRNFGLDPPVIVKKETPREPSRMSISQLLTPETSPYDPTGHQTENLKSIPTSRGSNNLALLTQKSLSEMEEYEKLINAAKRAASDEPEQDESHMTKRKSRRIVKMQSALATSNSAPSKMKAVQISSRLRQLNQKATIKLCLECCVDYHFGKKLHEVPEGSTLLYQSYPSLMRDLLNKSKRNLLDITT